MSEDRIKFHCPCCRHMTLGERSVYEICPVCFWEDESVGSESEPDEISGPNHISLNEGRANYAAYGACDLNMVQHVRAALPEEIGEARLKQEFSTAHHEWYLANHDRLVKKYTNANADDWKREYIFSLAAWNASKAESAALHETIATLRADATKAAEESVSAEHAFELAREIQELRADLARERDRHQWIPCEQKMPPTGTPVWVVWQGVVQYLAYTLEGEEWYPSCGDSDCAADGDFSHWMPMFDPPALLEPQPVATGEE